MIVVYVSVSDVVIRVNVWSKIQIVFFNGELIKKNCVRIVYQSKKNRKLIWTNEIIHEEKLNTTPRKKQILN